MIPELSFCKFSNGKFETTEVRFWWLRIIFGPKKADFDHRSQILASNGNFETLEVRFWSLMANSGPIKADFDHPSQNLVYWKIRDPWCQILVSNGKLETPEARFWSSMPDFGPQWQIRDPWRQIPIIQVIFWPQNSDFSWFFFYLISYIL